ncbi:helix-turn-helix domain-containing protein [Haloarculaceae archaeon H-GB2-1]|nr:helix-turn-helix domain-containing protein [Haloarculaceae archaeon H-GB1-1]MEA5408578.1 helix-turn-helix domain-containing protein [Haloarculaceae archaeon H-GB2-1]
MKAGIRAEVRIDAPSNCPVATVSGTTGASTQAISRSVSPTSPGRVTEEFMLDETADPDRDDMEAVFSYGSKDVYRFTRERGEPCPCESIEAYDCPIVDVYTRDSQLHLVFHAPDMECLQTVIQDVRDRYDSVDVQRLIRSEQDSAEENLVFVDRSQLTDRQLECLETAQSMGYFEHPKESNAGEVAEALGITTSTFTEHLAAAQKKLLSSLLDG